MVLPTPEPEFEPVVQKLGFDLAPEKIPDLQCSPVEICPILAELLTKHPLECLHHLHPQLFGLFAPP